MLRRFILWLLIAVLPLQGLQAAQHVRAAAQLAPEILAPAVVHEAHGEGHDEGHGDAPHDQASSHEPVASVLQHWLDHEHGVAHHHHDDGDVHYDDSVASQEHVGDHVGCQVSGLPQAVTAFVLPLVAGAPPVALIATGRPDPFLDKPPRPPHRLG